MVQSTYLLSIPQVSCMPRLPPSPRVPPPSSPRNIARGLEVLDQVLFPQNKTLHSQVCYYCLLITNILFFVYYLFIIYIIEWFSSFDMMLLHLKLQTCFFLPGSILSNLTSFYIFFNIVATIIMPAEFLIIIIALPGL